jgi:pimeloyl-ACP methyl ester carboxylesterase
MRYAVTAVATFLLIPAARADEKSFDADGVKITYLDQGEGEAVVLLHGFGTSAAEMWTRMPFAQTQFVTALKGYRVLAVDQRGHGGSGKPHDPKRYGKEMAEDVVRLLDHAKVKKAHVVGYSMGALVAGRVLASHPDRLLSVTFGGGSPLFQPPKEAGPIHATADSLEKGEGIAPLFLALTPPGEAKPKPEEAAAFSEFFLKGKDRKALAAVLRGFPELEVTEAELKANKVPVQFVYGSKEATLLTDGIGATRKLMPKGRVVVVKGGTHGNTFITPEFRTAVVEFLKANGG